MQLSMHTSNTLNSFIRAFSVLLICVHSILAWVSYGADPFHQPNATTLYWGSGDVDGDNSVTDKDLNLAKDMTAGSLEPACMADVNGDGTVNFDDILIFNQYLQKSIDHLPAWWNSMTSSDERKDWLLKAIAVDMTNTMPYDLEDTSWFICQHFSEQTALRLAGVRGSLNDNLLEAGQIGWNIPVYYAGIEGCHHAINAVLIGENPLNFNDWYFFEPQDDSAVVPGRWNMKPGKIYMQGVVPGGTRCAETIKFSFTLKPDLTATLDSSSVTSFFITTHTDNSSIIDNSISEWRFRCISSNGQDNIICNRARNDLSGNNDIYIGNYDDTRNGVFPTDNRYSYLLDVCKGNGSIIYLLWREKNTANKPSLFIGTYDLAVKKFESITEISNKGGFWYEGKLLFKDENHILAFWTENFGVRGADPKGIYCAMYNGSTSAPYQRIFDFNNEYGGDITPCFFDAAVMNDGSMMFVTRDWQGIIYQKSYSFSNQQWSDSFIVSDTSEVIQDVDIVKDAHGIMNLFYTSIDEKNVPRHTDSLGNKQVSFINGVYGKIKQRLFDNGKWSAPLDISTRDSTSSPYAICSADGSIYLACINANINAKNQEYNVVVNQYKNSTWTEIKSIKTDYEHKPQWPRLHISSEKKLSLLWEINYNDRISISKEIVTPDSVYEGIKNIDQRADATFHVRKSKTQITVSPLSKSTGATVISISDLSGRMLFTRTYDNMSKTEYINTDRFGSNTLILKVKNGSSVFAKKLIAGIM